VTPALIHICECIHSWISSSFSLRGRELDSIESSAKCSHTLPIYLGLPAAVTVIKSRTLSRWIRYHRVLPFLIEIISSSRILSTLSTVLGWISESGGSEGLSENGSRKGSSTSGLLGLKLWPLKSTKSLTLKVELMPKIFRKIYNIRIII